MPIKPKIGSVISGNAGNYKLINLITEGNMSWSLEARLEETNERVFLKYYKSPTPKVSWFEDYVNYVHTINKRLEDSAANQYCVLCNDLFTANPNPEINPYDYLFQAYEFIDSGQNLRDILNDDSISWERRKGIAKIFLVSMCKIHDVKVVHADLKPENVQMLPDDHTRLGIIPRMIDMDRSIMEDVVAPWTTGSDKEGYVGTPGYFSPEHLRGEIPTTASDVFTIGIILCELLCGNHPFATFLEDADDYREAVLQGNRYEPIGLIGDLGDKPGNAQQFEELLSRTLSPNPAERPTCKELHRSLLSLDRKASVALPPSSTPPTRTYSEEARSTAPSKTTHSTHRTKEGTVDTETSGGKVIIDKLPPTETKKTITTLQLMGDMGVFKARISMDVGRGALGGVSSESRYCARYQFKVERQGDTWRIRPCDGDPPATMTMVNGVELTAPVALNNGDVICLQGRTSGKQAMRLTVSFCS